MLILSIITHYFDKFITFNYHASKKGCKLAPIIDNCTIEVHKKPIKVFDDLIRSIVSQQLSTSAAATIYGRFLTGLDEQSPIGQQIINKSIEDLRAHGLSNAKANYIKNVAHHFESNQLYNVDWSLWSDDDIIAELTKIKGVGKWTVEMILMFSLHREDVLPLDDLIIRNNMIKLYDVKSEKKTIDRRFDQYSTPMETIPNLCL